MNREALVQALQAHNFGSTRFGGKIEVVVGTMDEPYISGNEALGLSFPVAAASRRIDKNRTLLEQCIEEISMDLELLTWDNSGFPSKYWYIVYKEADGFLRYAKATAVPDLGCTVLGQYANA